MPASRTATRGSPAVARRISPSYAPPERDACEPLGPEQQHDDEHGKYSNGRENAADEEVGGLLEEAEDQSRHDRAADIAHAAKRDRNEAVECQHRRVGEEGEQQLPARETRERTDHA